MEKCPQLPLGLVSLGYKPFGYNSTVSHGLTHQIYDLLKHPSCCLNDLSLCHYFWYDLSDEQIDDEVDLLVNAMTINNTLISLDLGGNELK